MSATLELADLAIMPISDARTIPSRWYTDPEIYRLEEELIFCRTWQWVGRVDQAASPGTYFTCEVAGEPVVVVRGADGVLRAFSNVCRHRGGPVAQGSGVLNRFRCAYHGWTYGLDGSLLGAPHFKGVEGFSKEENCLPQIQVATWGPLVLVNLDPKARPLSESLGDIPEYFKRYRLDNLTFSRQFQLEGAFNWKVYQENGRECYHCPSVHPSFRTAYEVEDAVVETFGLSSFMFVAERCTPPPSNADMESVLPPARNIREFRHRSPARRGLEGRERDGIYFVYMFPNLVLTLAPDHASASRTIAIGVDRTILVRDFFWEPTEGSDAELFNESNLAFRMQTIKEDIAICEAVQKGLRARHYVAGRYSPKELGVYHFHTLLRQFLSQDLHGSGAW